MPNWTELQPYPISTEEDFVVFLDQVGLCLWRPEPNLPLPNLADRMDLAKPDDIWDTWFWKDDLHIAKRLFYGKLLAGRPTFVSPALLPYVVAARGDVDPHNLRDAGRLPSTTVQVYDALVSHRRLAVRELKSASGLSAPGDKAAFEAATESLSALFQIAKVGITGRTRGTYGYIWGLMEEWLPDTLSAAARLRPGAAARHIVEHLGALGVEMKPATWKRLFGWDDEVMGEAMGR